jgi:hypothetical protein
VTAPVVILLAVCAVVILDVLWLMHRAHQRDDEMLALLRQQAAAAREAAASLKLLDFISAQFRTDHGTSLRDVIDRLDEAAQVSQRSADLLKVQADVTRELAGHDRQRLDRLMTLVGYLDEHVAEGAATGIRIETAAGEVAEDLAARYERAGIKAQDDSSLAGEAADAAAVLPPEESR